MKTTFAVLAAAAAVASAQGIPAGTLIPTGGIPSGAKSTYPGKFEITVVLAPTKRDLQTRQSTCSDTGALVAQLSNGILTDAQGRIGGIVANGQFQFDGPPSQTGTIYNGGWSVLTNGSLAIGPSAVFYQCLSGTFYNLYDRSTGAQCQQVLIDIIPCGSTGGAVATQSKDGQPAGPSATQISDGQIQATSAKSAVTQIGDGQIQASSARPVPVSQYTDGQIQVTTVVTAKPTPVTQISDGQIQATSAKSSAKPVTQISDGQIQATSAKPKPVTQISDGQIQATSAKPVPVTQISDGQIQATSAAKSSTLSRVPVTQISDGQIQATSATTSAPARFTGAANALSYGSYGVAAVGAAFMALL